MTLVYKRREQKDFPGVEVFIIVENIWSKSVSKVWPRRAPVVDRTTLANSPPYLL